MRATRDLDIVPAPSLENCRRPAALLAELGAEQIGVDANLLPNQPTDPAGLAEGGRFQLTTALGRLDILQESDAIPPYRQLAASAVRADFRGHEILVCSLADLVAMKRRAPRPQDIADLAALESPRTARRASTQTRADPRAHERPAARRTERAFVGSGTDLCQGRIRAKIGTNVYLARYLAS